MNDNIGAILRFEDKLWNATAKLHGAMDAAKYSSFSNFLLAFHSCNKILIIFNTLVNDGFKRIIKHLKLSRVLTKFRDNFLHELLLGEVRIQEAEQKVVSLL
jgi:hypothetical protein